MCNSFVKVVSGIFLVGSRSKLSTLVTSNVTNMRRAWLGCWSWKVLKWPQKINSYANHLLLILWLLYTPRVWNIMCHWWMDCQRFVICIYRHSNTWVFHFHHIFSWKSITWYGYTNNITSKSCGYNTIHRMKASVKKPAPREGSKFFTKLAKISR